MNIYCTMVRDCMPWLANNIYQVLRFKNPEDKILIVENNSVDGSKEFLYDLHLAKNSRRRYMDDYENEIIVIGEEVDLPKFGQKPLKERADYLAGLRNSYLDFIKNNFEIERLIVFDSDLWDLDVRSWNKLFTDYTATCANGLITIVVGNIRHQIYYDTWAYLSLDKDFVHGVKNPVPLMQPPGLVEVRSAFGGVACYIWDEIKDCRYSFFDLKKLHENGKPMTLGEHGGFNSDIRSKGGKVMIQTECIPHNMRFPL